MKIPQEVIASFTLSNPGEDLVRKQPVMCGTVSTFYVLLKSTRINSINLPMKNA